jgi:type II secretion system protein J
MTRRIRTASRTACRRTPAPSRRRGFTLVEVIIAAVVAAFVIGSLATSIGQLARARDTSKTRLDAHMRADAALSAIRSDVASVIRHHDLHWTRLYIRDGMYRFDVQNEFDRDEILVFATRLRAVNDLDFQGEGMQHEIQYRVEHDDYGAALWQRRDPVPDEFPLGGGIATPIVQGILGVRFEAYDGYEWRRRWDSDEFGLPYAVRITVVASGHRNSEDLLTAPRAVLRTVVAIDRVVPPMETIEDDEEIDPEELEDVSDPTITEPAAPDTPGTPGGPGDPRGPGAPGTGAQPTPGTPPSRTPGAGRPGTGSAPGGQRPGGGRPSGGSRPGGQMGNRPS